MAEQKWLVNPGESRTLDLDGVSSVKVNLARGRIDIIGHDESESRVQVQDVAGRDIKISLDDGALVIDHPQLDLDNFIDVFRAKSYKARAGVTVLVPRHVEIKVSTVSADVIVSGITATGPTRLSTVSGAITVEGSTCDLELNTVSGEVAAHNHTGVVSVHTVSGEVTAAGAIPRFDCDGVSGNVFADIVGVPEKVRSHTVGGDLTLRLDPGVGARYRVNTVSGTLQVGDSVFKGQAARNFGYQDGPLDGQWVEVVLNSVSGNLSVVRREAAAASA